MEVEEGGGGKEEGGRRKSEVVGRKVSRRSKESGEGSSKQLSEPR